MRILLTTNPGIMVPPTLHGGIERIVDVLAQGLQSRGHEVGLIAAPGSLCPVNYFRGWTGASPLNKIDTLCNIWLLQQAYREFKPDVINLFSRGAYLGGLLFSKVPKVVSYQLPPGQRPVSYLQRLGGHSLNFTGCSEYICNLGHKGGGVWHPIHNFVEINKYTFSPEVSSDAPLVFLSRIEAQKGPHLAIEIAKKANRRLLIAGNHSHTEEAKRFWQEQIEPELGKNNIEYIGPVDDVAKNQLLGEAAALVVPVLWDEPFGIVFIEAMACGTPVISHPRGALPEIVRHGIDGYLVNSIEEAVSAVPNLSNINRRDCRQRAEDYFSASVTVDKYEKLYNSLIP